MVCCNSQKSASIRKPVFQNEPGSENGANYGEIGFGQSGTLPGGLAPTEIVHSPSKYTIPMIDREDLPDTLFMKNLQAE